MYKSNRKFIKIHWMSLITILVIAGFIISWEYQRRSESVRVSGGYVKCWSNLKRIREALDEYAREHDGRYPESLSGLVPAHIESIPECPSVGLETYSGGYEVNEEAGIYTIFCRGPNHKERGIPENYPRYSSKYSMVFQGGSELDEYEAAHKSGKPVETSPAE